MPPMATIMAVWVNQTTLATARPISFAIAQGHEARHHRPLIGAYTARSWDDHAKAASDHDEQGLHYGDALHLIE